MAQRDANPVSHLQVGIVLSAGRFRPNGGSAIDNSLNEGVGFTAARISAGLFRLTFPRIGYKLVHFDAKLWLNATDDLILHVGPWVPASKTIDLIVRDISAAAAFDVASHANNWISWAAHWQNDRIKKGG